MKKSLWLPATLLLFFLADRAGGFLLQKITDESQMRYSRLYRGDAAADILLLGNSRGLTFYQPFIDEKSGKRSFNLSYNGLPMDLGHVLAADYLERYPPPGVLLIDITTLDRRNDALITGFLPYVKNSARLSGLIHEKSPTSWWGGRASELFRFNNEVFQRAFYHLNTSDADWLLDREIAPALAAEVEKNHYDLKIDTFLVDELAATTRLAQQKGVAVRLVISPYFPGFAGNVGNLDALKSICEQRTGFPVKDYSRSLDDCPACFGDFMHPNKKGAARYIDLMRADGVLP